MSFFNWLKSYLTDDPKLSVRGYIYVRAELNSTQKIFSKLAEYREEQKYYVSNSRAFGYDSVLDMQNAIDDIKMMLTLTDKKMQWGSTGASFIEGLRVGSYQLDFIEDLDRNYKEFRKKHGKDCRSLREIRVCEKNGYSIVKIIRCKQPINKFIELM